MSVIENSVWPNGLKEDNEGYAVFYPLGTNKIDITTVTWPDGDKLISPFVYKNDELVGFCDTKAMTVSGSATTTMNYSHIEADFSSIIEGMLTVNAPNAIVKKFSWTVVNSGGEQEGDTRPIKTKYDIWANAEVENEDGTITIKNLYIPDASSWFTDFSDEMNYYYQPFSSTRSLTRNVIDNKVYFTDEEELDLENLGEPDAMFQTSKIVNGNYLFARSQPSPGFGWGESNETVCPKMIFNSNLDNLKYARRMFATDQEDAYQDGYLDFVSNLSNLIDGHCMFSLTILTKFEQENGNPVNLDNLENGFGMFCVSGAAHNYFGSINMPKLKIGNSMFSNGGVSLLDGIDKTLEEWSGNLDSLEEGVRMFGSSGGYGYDGCKILRFNSNLPKLKLGAYMSPCVLEFRGSLPALENGYDMFKCHPYNDEYSTQLDGTSIRYIVSSLPDRTGLDNIDGEPDGEWDMDTSQYNYENNTKRGYIDIGCGCENTDEDKQLYAEEGGFSSFQDILDQFSAKNWAVRFDFNGRPTQTYSLRREINSQNSIWVKLEEVDINEEIVSFNDKKKKPYYNYASVDETKFFELKSFHESNTAIEGYTQFNSLEEAIEHFDIKPIERTR